MLVGLAYHPEAQPFVQLTSTLIYLEDLQPNGLLLRFCFRKDKSNQVRADTMTLIIDNSGPRFIPGSRVNRMRPSSFSTNSVLKWRSGVLNGSCVYLLTRLAGTRPAKFPQLGVQSSPRRAISRVCQPPFKIMRLKIQIQSWRCRVNTIFRGRSIAIVVLVVFCLNGTSSAQVRRSLPSELSDQEFWDTVTDLSEPSGPYTGDNWISNEASIQQVIPPLKQLAKPGGVYLGVGPEQNFTYMWALQSKFAFIIDIRRQNMLEIFLFKALFEMSPTRADFVSNLFSRRRPAGLDTNTNVKALMAAYASAPSEGLQRNIETVRSTIAKHGYALSAADLQRIAFVHEIFNRGGPSITAEMFSPGSPGGVPVTYTDLMTATDRNGQAWSYLSTEAAYQYIREMHRKNLIIPLVGNFAGPKTIRRVSEYLKQRNQTVAAFYLSNVEYYLEGQVTKDFHANVATLPIDSSSMLIRWVPRPGIPFVPWYKTDMGVVVTTLTPISELVDLHKAGKAPTSWPDMLQTTRDSMTLVARKP